MSGKGDKPRPIEDYDKFSNNWDLIFGKKKAKEDGTLRESEKPIEQRNEKSNNS